MCIHHKHTFMTNIANTHIPNKLVIHIHKNTLRAKKKELHSDKCFKADCTTLCLCVSGFMLGVCLAVCVTMMFVLSIYV